jgi:hypothetical protein
MFCHITENWRGRPLVSHAVVVNLIGSTRTRTGLRIRAELDTNEYPKGIKVTDQELELVQLKKDRFLRLCWSQHNRNYAQFPFMRSPLLPDAPKH